MRGRQGPISTLNKFGINLCIAKWLNFVNNNTFDCLFQITCLKECLRGQVSKLIHHLHVHFKSLTLRGGETFEKNNSFSYSDSFMAGVSNSIPGGPSVCWFSLFLFNVCTIRHYFPSHVQWTMNMNNFTAFINKSHCNIPSELFCKLEIYKTDYFHNQPITSISEG